LCRDHAGHHINDPLGINDDVIAQEVVVKVLDGSQVMEQLDGHAHVTFVKDALLNRKLARFFPGDVVYLFRVLNILKKC